MATWEMTEPVVSLRDQFAMAAMQGMLAYSYCSASSGNYHENGTPAVVAEVAYGYADAMLKARAALAQEPTK